MFEIQEYLQLECHFAVCFQNRDESGKRDYLYYLAIGKAIDPSVPIIRSSIDIFLLTTCAFFIVGEKYYQKNNDGQAFDPIVTRRLKYLIFGFVLAALFLPITSVFVDTPSTPWVFGVWIRGKMLTILLIIHLVIAIGTIFNADQIQSYILKLMTNIYDQAFFLNIYLVPLFLFILIHGCLYIIYQAFDIQIPEFIHGQVLNPKDQALTVKDDCDYWRLITKSYAISMYHILCSICVPG